MTATPLTISSQVTAPDQTMIREARISADGLYRYELIRQWRPGTVPMAFVMLNPSTADHMVDDPTIRRCIHFAAREGYGGLVVINLFAGRATDPRDLFKMADPAGPENEKTWYDLLTHCYNHGAPVVCAWGANRKAVKQAEKFRGYAASMGVPLFCLNSVTQQGFPRHPLYLPNDSLLRRFA